MALITNKKVTSLIPVWAPFHGFSLLFDNPGSGLKPMGGLKKITCNVDTDPVLSLYKALADSLETVGPDVLMNTCLFCTLPYDSYHVTMWDGVNDGNLSRIATSYRKELETYLKGFPDSFSKPGKITKTVNASPLATKSDWNIRFRFEKLAVWANKALVACLSPVDEVSESILNQMLIERKKLNDRIGGLLDMDMQRGFKPHISLGYFANSDFADHCKKDLEGIEKIFTDKTENVSIAFDSVTLYGFTDMATFFRQ